MHVLPDAEWRRYEDKLIDQFLAADYDPAKPPQVIDLLHQDKIPPQEPEAMRKVDRYAPAAAAIITISGLVVDGHGRDASYFDKNIYFTTRGPFERLMCSAAKRWRLSAMTRYKDSNSPLKSFLAIFDDRTAKPHVPAGKFVNSNHILQGGDIGTISGFLAIVHGVAGDYNDDEQRRELYHALVPVDLGRATVHQSTIGVSTPPWSQVGAVMLYQNRQGGAPTLRTARTHEHPRGQRLWRDGDHPDDDVRPLLKCPAHRDNQLPGESEHPTQTPLKDVHHASINEGFELGIL